MHLLPLVLSLSLKKGKDHSNLTRKPTRFKFVSLRKTVTGPTKSKVYLRRPIKSQEASIECYIITNTETPQPPRPESCQPGLSCLHAASFSSALSRVFYEKWSHWHKKRQVLFLQIHECESFGFVLIPIRHRRKCFTNKKFYTYALQTRKFHAESTKLWDRHQCEVTLNRTSNLVWFFIRIMFLKYEIWIIV